MYTRKQNEMLILAHLQTATNPIPFFKPDKSLLELIQRPLVFRQSKILEIYNAESYLPLNL